MHDFTAGESDDASRPGLIGRLWYVLRVAMIAWGGVMILAALAQRSMIYHPSRGDAALLEDEAAAQGFEPWKNQRGETIGYRSPAAMDDSRPPLTIVIFHGNAGHALHRTAFAPLLRSAMPGHAVTINILEYPGYGARVGSPSQDSFLNAANEALTQIPTDTPVILLGESIGTGVAAATAASNPGRVGGVLLLTPFDSLAAVAQHHYPLLPVRWILWDKYPSADWLKNYHGPVAMILAENDTIVPAKFGRKLHDSYTGPKKLIVAGNADHNDILHTLPPSSWHDALSFLIREMRPASPDAPGFKNPAR